MGLILDTSILIASERRKETVEQLLAHIEGTHGNVSIALSAVSVVELTHGIYRARSDADRTRRQAFVEQVFRSIPIHPITFEIAQLAGRLEGEEAAKGNILPFEDLLIGCTALHLNYAVLTLNINHFIRIPTLTVASL